MKSFNSVFIFLSTSLISYLIISFQLEKTFSINLMVDDSLSTISLAFVGDLMCHTPQIQAARVLDGNLNFKSTFDYVRDYISSADLAFGNLETTIGDSNDRFTGYPLFRSPAEYLDGLIYAGFDFLFTANNHILDYDEKGIIKTLKHLKQKNLRSTGAFESFEDYDSLRILDMNRIKLGMISATFSTNGNPIPEGKKYLVNLIDLDSLRNQIHRLRIGGSDIIIINLHFGEEYSTAPNKFQRMIVDSLIIYGADLIIGNHPHVLQPVEIRKAINSKIDSVVVAYSLGNFISNQRKILTATGVVLRILIEKNFRTDEIYLKQVQILPTYVFKGRINKRIEYKIIPLTEDFILADTSHLNFIDKNFLEKVYNQSKKILYGKNTENLNLTFR